VESTRRILQGICTTVYECKDDRAEHIPVYRLPFMNLSVSLWKISNETYQLRKEKRDVKHDKIKTKEEEMYKILLKQQSLSLISWDNILKNLSVA
jgi:hypothetical protein